MKNLIIFEKKGEESSINFLYMKLKNYNYMNRDVDFDFIPEDGNDDEMDFVPDWSDADDNNPEDDNCPYLSLITALVLQDKPFGIMWTVDKMMELLKSRGYKLLDRKDSEGNDYTVAVKPSDSSIPDDGHSNIKEVFDNEIQDIIMKFILRIAKENDSTKF